jgi:hypothetical protein
MSDGEQVIKVDDVGTSSYKSMEALKLNT